MKILQGLVISTNGDKKRCSRCNRLHGRSFVTKDSITGKLEHWGSGCILTQDIDRLQMIKVLLKINIQMNRLAESMLKDVELDN